MVRPTSTSRVRISSGAQIVREGEQDDCAYLIERGHMEVFTERGGRRIVLARLGPGQYFGEMGLLQNSIRTASVMALEPSVLRPITREVFNRLLQRQPKSILPLIQVLFERLRIMNLKYLLALETQSAASADASTSANASRSDSLPCGVLTLVGETPLTRMIVGEEGLAIRKFPFRIGLEAREGDAFALNDLSLPQTFQQNVSQHQCTIDLAPDGTLLVQDRGSIVGTIVNGQRLGTRMKRLEAALIRSENTLILGGATSPLRFRLLFRSEISPI